MEECRREGDEREECADRWTIGCDLGRNVIHTLDGKTDDVEVNVTATVTELSPIEARE